MYLTLPWKGVVFHHLHQAYPKKAFPNEAFQMGIQEGPASTTGVYSLDIQLQGLHQFLMWQAMQPFIFKEKILEEATIMWKHPNKYTYCGKSSDKLVWTKTTLSMDFKPFILIRYFSLVYREYSSVQEVTLPSNPIFLLFTGNIAVSKR